MNIRIPLHFYWFQLKINKHNVFYHPAFQPYTQYFNISLLPMYPNSCRITRRVVVMSCSTENIHFTQQDSFINSNSFTNVKKK